MGKRSGRPRVQRRVADTGGNPVSPTNESQILAPIFNASSISVTNLISDIYELSTRNVLPSGPPAEKLLARFPDEIISVFPSPNGQVIAFAVG